MSTTTFFRTQRLDGGPSGRPTCTRFVGYRADPEVARYQSRSDYTVADGTALVATMQKARPGVPGQWYQFALKDRSTGTFGG